LFVVKFSGLNDNIFLTRFIEMMVLGDYQTSASLAGVDLSQNSRRLSTRSIKRKKFDDELVESSLIKSDRPRPRQQSASETRILLPGQSTSITSVVTEHIDVPTPPVTVERKKVHKVCNIEYLLCNCYCFHNSIG